MDPGTNLLLSQSLYDVPSTHETYTIMWHWRFSQQWLWSLLCSGTWHRAVLLRRTNILLEPVTFTFSADPQRQAAGSPKM